MHSESAFKGGFGIVFFLVLKKSQARGEKHALPKVQRAKEPGHRHLPGFGHQKESLLHPVPRKHLQM